MFSPQASQPVWTRKQRKPTIHTNLPYAFVDSCRTCTRKQNSDIHPAHSFKLGKLILQIIRYSTIPFFIRAQQNFQVLETPLKRLWPQNFVQQTTFKHILLDLSSKNI